MGNRARKDIPNKAELTLDKLVGMEPLEAGMARLHARGLPMEKQPCVYLLARKRNGTLYVGVTTNLTQRIWQHKNALAEGFTKKYGVKLLVWYELHSTIESAISREKVIKNWQRSWKLNLVERSNPNWKDLYPEIL